MGIVDGVMVVMVVITTDGTIIITTITTTDGEMIIMEGITMARMMVGEVISTNLNPQNQRTMVGGAISINLNLQSQLTMVGVVISINRIQIITIMVGVINKTTTIRRIITMDGVITLMKEKKEIRKRKAMKSIIMDGEKGIMVGEKLKVFDISLIFDCIKCVRLIYC